MIGDVLLGKIEMTPSGMAALFLADRILHNTDPDIGIKSALERGEWVICDRYYYSSFAYQGKDTDLDWVIRQNLDCPDILKPDVCIFLDLALDVARSRRDARETAQEIFERPEVKTSSIRDTFLAVFGKLDDNIKIIDADGTIDEVAERILHAVEA
jgi:dTMP kinase